MISISTIYVSCCWQTFGSRPSKHNIFWKVFFMMIFMIAMDLCIGLYKSIFGLPRPQKILLLNPSTLHIQRWNNLMSFTMAEDHLSWPPHTIVTNQSSPIACTFIGGAAIFSMAWLVDWWMGGWGKSASGNVGRPWIIKLNNNFIVHCCQCVMKSQPVYLWLLLWQQGTQQWTKHTDNNAPQNCCLVW